MSNPQQEQEDRELNERMGRIRHKILILSGKGGVGKSTFAANLAVGLARAGHRTGILDVDLHGPSIPTLLGLAGSRLETDARGRVQPIKRDDGLAVVSIGFLLENKADPVIWRGPLKYNAIRQFLRDVDWGELDYLVVDSPPGTGDEPLSVAQLAGAGTRAVLVTTPQEVSVADVRRSISFCRMLELTVDGVVENMSGLECPHCGKTIELFGSGGGERLAGEMGVPFLGRIPLDPGVVGSGDAGAPFARDPEQSPAGRAFAAIAERLAQRKEKEDPDPA